MGFAHGRDCGMSQRRVADGDGRSGPSASRGSTGSTDGVWGNANASANANANGNGNGNGNAGAEVERGRRLYKVGGRKKRCGMPRQNATEVGRELEGATLKDTLAYYPVAGWALLASLGGRATQRATQRGDEATCTDTECRVYGVQGARSARTGSCSLQDKVCQGTRRYLAHATAPV